MNNIKTINGIDSLYYFCESNLDYDDLFLEILDQIEFKVGIFEKKGIEYQNSDVIIELGDIQLNYKGKAEGFYWFSDMSEFFKIGFKDRNTNQNLNDIRVQLQAWGIYTIGIKSLIQFINEKILDGYITGYMPITRADLNCFIQYDFSFLNKEMFSTRKRKYSTINEIGSAKETQTIYVGKAPFLLRVYNKKEELKKSPKKDLMYEHFANNDFNLEESIWNVEFELHRTHLKQYRIETVDDLFSNAVKLFSQCMDDIRLIDLTSISQKELINNKYKAQTHEIWKYIKDQYSIKGFLETSLPLEKIQRAIYIYDDTKFKTDMVTTIRRGMINNLHPMPEDMDYYYYEAKRSLEQPTTPSEIKKNYEDLSDYINPETGKREPMRRLEDGTLIKPVKVVAVNELSNYDLLVYLDKLVVNKDLSDHDNNLWKVAHYEAMKRNLFPIISNDEALESGEES